MIIHDYVIFAYYYIVIFRYENNLTEARKFGIKKGTINGSALGVVFFILFCSYALAFWYGNQLVREGVFTGGDVLVVSGPIILYIQV